MPHTEPFPAEIDHIKFRKLNIYWYILYLGVLSNTITVPKLKEIWFVYNFELSTTEPPNEQTDKNTHTVKRNDDKKEDKCWKPRAEAQFKAKLQLNSDKKFSDLSSLAFVKFAVVCVCVCVWGEATGTWCEDIE